MNVLLKLRYMMYLSTFNEYVEELGDATGLTHMNRLQNVNKNNVFLRILFFVQYIYLARS